MRVLRDSARVGLADTLRVAAQRWEAQYKVRRPLQIRSAAPRALHDRLIIVDGGHAYLVTQSFKDLAERAHASLQRVDQAAAEAKRDAYEDIWANSPIL
ncbi:hypothetical protein H1235_07955 [Pseudoxanthomonas sp. NC8]|nr:hypothetical protein H1235_07955 [Pseudoxanthomonas sp. NC8]